MKNFFKLFFYFMAFATGFGLQAQQRLQNPIIVGPTTAGQAVIANGNSVIYGINTSSVAAPNSLLITGADGGIPLSFSTGIISDSATVQWPLTFTNISNQVNTVSGVVSGVISQNSLINFISINGGTGSFSSGFYNVSISTTMPAGSELDFTANNYNSITNPIQFNWSDHSGGFASNSPGDYTKLFFLGGKNIQEIDFLTEFSVEWTVEAWDTNLDLLSSTNIGVANNFGVNIITATNSTDAASILGFGTAALSDSSTFLLSGGGDTLNGTTSLTGYLYLQGMITGTGSMSISGTVNSSNLQFNNIGSNINIGNGPFPPTLSGISNTAVGYFALEEDSSGSNNTVIGAGAFGDNTVGSYNTIMGVNSLNGVITNSNNTAYGYDTAYNATFASNVSLFGYGAGRGAATVSNVTVLGANVSISATITNSIFIGDGDGTAAATYSSGAWSLAGGLNTGTASVATTLSVGTAITDSGTLAVTGTSTLATVSAGQWISGTNLTLSGLEWVNTLTVGNLELITNQIINPAGNITILATGGSITMRSGVTFSGSATMDYGIVTQTLSATGAATLSGTTVNISGGSYTNSDTVSFSGTESHSGVVNFTNTTASTGTTTGALILSGGLGVQQAISVGTAITDSGTLKVSSPATFTSTILTGTATVTGMLSVANAATLSGLTTLLAAVTTSLCTVATLPSATTSAGYQGSPGSIVTVTDSAVTVSSTTVGTTPTGGSSNKILLLSNGSAWIIP